MSAHVVERLSAYLDGEVPAPERAAVEVHLRECAECARQLEELAALDTLARELPAEPPAGYFDTFASRVRGRIKVRARPGPWRLPAWTLAAAAALVLAVVAPLTWRERGVPALAPRYQPAPAAARPPERAPTPPPASRAAAELGFDQAERLKSAGDLGGVGGEEGKKRAGQEGEKADKEGRESTRVSSGAPKARRPEPQLDENANAARGERAAGRSAPPATEAVATRSAEQADRLEALGYAGEEAQKQQAAPADKENRDNKTSAAPPRQEAKPKGFAAEPPSVKEEEVTSKGKSSKLRDRPMGDADSPAAPSPQGAALASGALSKDEARRLRADGAAAAGDETRYQELVARRSRNVDEARALRSAWRAFASDQPGDPRADEARVRALEAGAAAWRLGGDPADLAAVREDARAYLARPDAQQAQRVKALLKGLER